MDVALSILLACYTWEFAAGGREKHHVACPLGRTHLTTASHTVCSERLVPLDGLTVTENSRVSLITV
jgi:hypothetical protein